MIQGAGIVGLGGAAFPSHVKFKIPEGKSCRYLMLNGCECEPFLTCDHRVMVEYAEALIDGVAILQQFIKAEKVYIAIEANKPDAMAMLEEAAAGKYPVEIVPLQVKYPQGAEKMMISAILGKEVPSGKLPIDLGVLVANVGTIVAISDYFRKGKPLIERVITVTGPAVERPANVLVPIGTPMIEVVDFCGGINAEKIRILLGGPMMGVVQKSLDAPVLKGTSGILVLNDETLKPAKTFPCINCGHCVDACPMLLNPARLGELSKHNQWAAMKEHHALDCFECGACAYVCPSHIPLVQRIKVGKGMIKQLSR
jgi:electron transport complex protein RnfC